MKSYIAFSILILISVGVIIAVELANDKEKNSITTISSEQETGEVQEVSNGSLEVANETENSTPILSKIELPNTLNVVSSTDDTMTLEHENYDIAISIGESLAPIDECRDYYHNTQTNEETSPYTDSVEREHVTHYLCYPQENIDGYEIPLLAASYPLDEYATGQQARESLAEIAYAIFEQQYVDSNPPYSIEELYTAGSRLAQWADTFNVTVEVNNQPLVLEGPNPGGTSPVIWPPLGADGYGFSYTKTISLYAHMATTLSSPACSAVGVFAYLQSLEPKPDAVPSSTEQFRNDLSCFDSITFSPVFTGTRMED